MGDYQIFGADWCYYTKKQKETIEKGTTKEDGNVYKYTKTQDGTQKEYRFAYINCADEKSKQKCMDANVRAFPTIKKKNCQDIMHEGYLDNKDKIINEFSDKCK